MVDQTAEESLLAAEPESNHVEDHIALIFDRDEERLTTITPLIKVGLEKGELCLYVSDEENDTAIVEALKAEHVDVDKAVSNGSLILTSKKEMYFKLGRFDPEWTIRVINNIADLARSYGFTAMRVMSEMAWTQEKVPGVERWPEYEARMNTLNPGISLRIICQYDRRQFAPEALMAAIQTHPRVVAEGEINKNSFYIPTDRLLHGNYAEAELERVLSTMRSINSSESALQERDRAIEAMGRQAEADTAARKSLEAALDESRRRFKDLAERASDWAWELDEKGTYVYSSPRIKDILGLQPEEVIGKAPLDLVSKEAAERTAKLLARAMSSHAPISALEIEARHKDGHTVFLEMSGTPHFDHEGKFLGYRGVDRDISGRKASKQAIEESRKRAEESLAEIKARDERIAALDSEITSLRGSLSELDTSIAALREDLDGKEAQLNEAVEGLSRLNESLQTREAELVSLRAAQDEKQAKLEAQDEEIAGLKKQLEDKGGELTGIQATLAAAQLLIKGKAAELEELTSSFKAQSLELKGARESLSGVEETLAHKEEEHFAMRQQIERLEADLLATRDSLSARNEELSKAQQELSEAKSSLEQRSSELNAANEALAQKEKELSAAGELAEQRGAEIAAANETIELRTSELAAANSSLEQRIAELATVREVVERKESELAAANELAEGAKAELAVTKATLESTVSELEDTRRQLGQRDEELRTANEAVESKVAEIASLSMSLEQQASELKAASELAEQRASELNAANGLAEQRAGELAAAEARMAEKEAGLAEALATVETLKASLASRLSDLEARTTERDARVEDLARMAEEKNALEAALAAKGAELAAAIASYEGSKADVAALTEELQLARESFERSESERMELSAVISAKDAALADLRSEADKVAADLAAREADLTSLRSALGEREIDLARTASRADMLGKVLALKEEELAASLRTSEARRNEVSRLSSAASKLEADQNVNQTVIEGLRAAMEGRRDGLAKALAEGRSMADRMSALAAEKDALAERRMTEVGALREKVRELEAARDVAAGEADKMRRAFFGLPYPAAVVSPEGLILMSNPVLEQLTSPGLVGRPVSELWPGIDIGEPGVVRTTVDGKPMEMKVLPSALREGTQDVGTVLAFSEPTPVKEAAAGPSPEVIAHDLNDSLQVIMGSVSLAKEYVIPEGRMYSKLKQIESASATARDLAGKLMTPAREVHLPAPAAPSNLTRGKGRLLLMDDDENVLEATGDLLRYLGYNVEVARDGEEAVAMCKEAEEIWQSYDLAMVDLSITSGMGGIEASKKLVAMNPNIKLIVTSGYVADPIIADPASQGFAAALSKPYSAELLSKTIFEVLAARSAE